MYISPAFIVNVKCNKFTIFIELKTCYQQFTYPIQPQPATFFLLFEDDNSMKGFVLIFHLLLQDKASGGD